MDLNGIVDDCLSPIPPATIYSVGIVQWAYESEPHLVSNNDDKLWLLITFIEQLLK